MHSVVANQDPSPRPDDRHPIVIPGIRGKMVLEVLHPRWQPQHIQRSWEGGPNVAVEK